MFKVNIQVKNPKKTPDTSTRSVLPKRHTKMDKKPADKLIYRLEEVSRIAQLDPKIIENWEKEFYFLHAGRTAAGHKIFRKKDLTIILRLKELIESQGLTLAGAKRRIEEEFGFAGKDPLNPDQMKKILFEVRERLKEIANTLKNP
ncbi:MAG: MerR family transcriptional regulator [Acidobacteriota bacterium]|nr:MerR family transcriptional regulator [Acidobacteriota bacterium]